MTPVVDPLERRESTPFGQVASYRLVSPGGAMLLVWHWYAVDGWQSPSAYRAKAATAWSLATGHGDHSVAVTLVTPIGDEGGAAALQSARSRLAKAATALAPAVDAASRGRTATAARNEKGPPHGPARAHIVHVVHRLDTGGMENGLVNLVNRLPASRFRHTIVSLTGVGPIADRIANRDVEVVRLDRRPGPLSRELPRLWRLFRSLRRRWCTPGTSARSKRRSLRHWHRACTGSR